jgi:hypothetical protein
MQREILSNTTQLPAYDRVLAMDKKIRTYLLPEFLQIDVWIQDNHQAQQDMILVQKVSLMIVIHGGAPNVARP